MAISLVRELGQKQKVTLTPQLKKSIDLLQLSRQEIIQKINLEIETNPFLEKDESELTEYVENEDFFSSDYQKDIVANQTLREILLKQLDDLNLDKKDNKISISIINSLNESGELIEGIDEIENLLNFQYSYHEIEQVLINIIHQMDPPGIGFRNIKETIYIQLKKKRISSELMEICEIILFKSLGINIQNIKKELASSFKENSIDESIQLIKSCDLAPGLSYEETQYVMPDLIVIDGESKNVNFINDQFPVIQIDEVLINSIKKELKKKHNEGIVEKINDDKIDFIFNIIETENIYIGKINIFGNNITSEEFIRDNLFLSLFVVQFQ